MTMAKGRLLTSIDRQVLESRLKQGQSHRQIAKALGRSQGVVSAEIKRNSSSRGYRSVLALELTYRRIHSVRPCKIDKYPELKAFIITGIISGLSPEQTVGVLKTRGPTNLQQIGICVESIYTWIFEGSGKLEGLKQHLRRQRLSR